MARRGESPAPDSNDESWLKALGRVLSHPARVAILFALQRNGTISPTEAADAQDLSVGTSAYHMRTLPALGLVRVKKTRPVRGAVEHFYELTPDGQVAVRAIEAVTALGSPRSQSSGPKQRSDRSRRRA